MRLKVKTYFNVIYLIVGAILIGLAVFEKLDSFWSGMGSALMVVGIINLLKAYRLNKNEEYREKMEIELSDERNHFIRNKAWAWSGYIFVMLSAVASIIFKVIGQDMLSIFASASTCLVLVLFWMSYLILRRKY